MAKIACQASNRKISLSNRAMAEFFQLWDEIQMVQLQPGIATTPFGGKTFRLSKQIHQEDTLASDVVYYTSKRLLN
uniref:Uncharacterized protein n=1 Tax=Oryza rufipogon TaxID=4529 RepID=A0A0E0QPN4_ORYRU